MPPFVPDPSLFCAAYSIRYKLSACQSRCFKMSYVPLLTQLCLWCRAEWSEHTCAVRTYSSVLPVTPTSPYFFLSKALMPRLAELSRPAWRPLQVETSSRPCRKHTAQVKRAASETPLHTPRTECLAVRARKLPMTRCPVSTLCGKRVCDAHWDVGTGLPRH